MKYFLLITSLLILPFALFASQNDLSKSKGTAQDVIVQLMPSPAQEDVSRYTKIEASFNVPLDAKHVKKFDVKLKCLSCKEKNNIKGTVDYSEADKKVTFTPAESLTPGVYEVEFKSLKADESYKSTKIKEIKYRFLVVKEVLESLILSTEQTSFIKKQDEHHIKAPIKVMATYSDGHSEEVTDLVTWNKTNKKIRFYYDYFMALDGNFTVSASLNNVTSNEINIKIQNYVKPKGPFTVRVMNNDRFYYPGRSANIIFTPNKKPTADVKLKLRLNVSDGVRFLTNKPDGSLEVELVFKPESWDDIVTRRSSVHIVDIDRNNTSDYTIITETLVSEDQNYDGSNPDDIVIHKNNTIRLIEPPLQQRRGAIRGVPIRFRVLSKQIGLKYELVDPPQGMNILGHSDLGEWEIGKTDGVDVEWNVPMDIEEKTYTITMKANDLEGNEGQISFDIKVPKSTIIPTKIENNELVVVDKNSNLYGMKMKGHNGEDISNVTLRSVSYDDVWKKRIKNQEPWDIVQRTVFLIDNMPEKLDVKFPEYVDSIEEARLLGAGLYRYKGGFFIGKNSMNFWEEAVYNYYNYEGTNGTTLEYNIDVGLKYKGAKVFLEELTKSQNRGDFK